MADCLSITTVRYLQRKLSGEAMQYVFKPLTLAEKDLAFFNTRQLLKEEFDQLMKQQADQVARVLGDSSREERKY